MKQDRVLVGKLFVLSAILIAASCFLSEDLPEDSCVCTTEEAGVSRKAGYQHPIVRYLQPGACYLTAGGVSKIYGAFWYSLTVESQVIWCAGKFLTNGTFTNDICSLT